jgi:hypothetical protein
MTASEMGLSSGCRARTLHEPSPVKSEGVVRPLDVDQATPGVIGEGDDRLKITAK